MGGLYNNSLFGDMGEWTHHSGHDFLHFSKHDPYPLAPCFLVVPNLDAAVFSVLYIFTKANIQRRWPAQLPSGGGWMRSQTSATTSGGAPKWALNWQRDKVAQIPCWASLQKALALMIGMATNGEMLVDKQNHTAQPKSRWEKELSSQNSTWLDFVAPMT